MKNLAKPTEPLHQPGQWHLPAACLLAGGLLDGLTSMNLGWAWPVWLAPVFYLRTMDYLGLKKGFWAIVFTSFTSGVISAALTLPSLFADIIVMMLTMTLVSSGVYWLYHTLYANITGFKATLLFPALGTFLDYLLSWVHPFGSIASGAYLQHGLLPLIQLSSLTGIWGITFLVGWFGAVCHFIWKEGHYHSVRTVVAKAWPFWSAMLGVFCYGLLRLYMPAA
ncbi:MAG: hypothetical protein MUD08_06470, partial [Cytophagales bacterium]|nr:hypothetical protein [Cytophagales bacterium]